MKKFWIMLLSVTALVLCLFGAVACKSNDALSKYVLKQSGTLVEADFELPNKIGDKSVSWTSDKTAITIEKRSGETSLAKVTLGDEVESTLLTVKSGKKSKSFTVNVAALDVSYFVQKFVFAQDNATVYEDFELPTSFTLFSKTASIVWSVEQADEALISVVEEGGKTVCKVNQSPLNPEVRLYAEFDYKGVKQKTTFRMTVSFEREHKEAVDYWYYNTGVSVKMSGYVVAIGTAYSNDYENITLYMVDDDFCAGYYLYRVKTDKTTGAKLKPGVHVTVTGTTNTNYEGLVETNAGGELKIDEDVEEIDVTDSKYVHALDKDLLAKSRESLYHTSTIVSLTDWKVVEKPKSAPEEGKAGTLFTLQKGDVKVAVTVSKYLEGVYKTNKSDATYSALVALYNSVNVNDVVSVKGILGNYHGFQIMPLQASDVVTGGTEGAVPAECTKVASAITKVQDAFKSHGITSTAENADVCFKPDSGYIIVADQEITLPTEEGVEITCENLHNSGSVAIENGKLIVTVGAEDMASLKVTYTVKNGTEVLYTTSTYHIVHSMKMNDKDIVERLAFDFELKTTSTVADNVKLTTTVKEYPSATISWKLKEAVDGVTIEDNTIVVVVSTEKERKVVLVATFTSGTEHEEKEYEFTVGKAVPFKVGTYKFALEQNTLNKKLYFTGVNSDNRGTTSESYTDAVDVTVAEVANGYTFKVGNQYLELNSSHRLVLLDAPTGAWKYDYSLETFTWTVEAESKTYYLGTYGSYDTISASETWRISGTNASAVGESQFVAFFETPKELTDEEKADAALAKIEATLTVKLNTTVTLPTSGVTDVTLTWTLAEGSTGATLQNGVLTVTAADASVTLTATANCKQVTKTKPVTVTVSTTNYGTVDAPISVTEALAIAAEECKNSNDVTAQVVYMTGKAVNTPNYNSAKNYYESFDMADPADTTKSVLIYSINLRESIEAPAQNDVLVICGYIKNYNGTIEFASNSGVYVYVEHNTRGTSTITLGEHTGATVTGLAESAVNGTTQSFTVAPESGKRIEAVKVNGTSIEAAAGGGYSFTVVGNMTVTVETVSEDAPQTEEKTLTFDGAQTNYVAADSTENQTQVWKANGITFTNSKGGNTTNNVTVYGPVRCYAKTVIKVECANMTKIVFACNNTTYAGALKNTIGTPTGATVTIAEKNVTVAFDAPCNEFNIGELTAQVRIDSITVTVMPTTGGNTDAGNEGGNESGGTETQTLALVEDKKNY